MRNIFKWLSDPLFWDVISAQHDEGNELNHLYEKYGK